MELTQIVGVGDLQHAVRAETKRIAKETKGDALTQSKLLIGRLRKLNLLSEKETAAIQRLAEVGSELGAGKKTAKTAYLESRGLYNALLADGNASPVALVLASSAVGSYSISDAPDGSGNVVFAKSGNWSDRGAAAGAIIGSLWGPAGAAVGGAVGGLVGAAVDECKD